MSSLAGIVFALRHLADFAIFAFAAYLWGRLAGRALPYRDGFEQAVVSSALGLGVLASLLNLLAIARVLTPPAVAAVIAVPYLSRIVVPTAFKRLPLSLDRVSGIGVIALLPAVLLSLAFALYPPTAFDATLYHLPIAKAFARNHGIVFLPDLRFPVSPQLFETVFAGALSVADDVTAQLTQVFCLALVSAGLIAWGRRFASERAGIWAAAIWLGSPLVVFLGGTALVDVGLAVFCTFALYAWEAARESGDSRWLTASAVFAGLAASTKYLGLFFVVALAGATLFANLPGGRFRRTVHFSTVAALALAPFYWRIVGWTGSPVFPYLTRLFGDNAWHEWLDPLPANASRSGLRGEIVPGAGLFEGTILSPLLLLLFPIIVWRAVRDRRARLLLAVSLGYVVFWYLASPDKRYLLAILPAYGAGATAGLDAFLRRWNAADTRPARAGLAVCLALFLSAPGVAWNAVLLRRRGPLPVTMPERDAYLTRALPVYPALQSLNRRFGSRYVVYVLFREHAAYFADGRFLGEHFGPYRYARVTDALNQPRRLLGVLQEMRVTHLLVDRTSPLGSRIRLQSLATTLKRIPSPPYTALFEVPDAN